MILIHTPAPREVAAYLDLFRTALPQHVFTDLEGLSRPEDVEYVITWGPPPGLFVGMSRLKGVFNLGAGVDRLLQRDDLAAEVPIYRLLDGGMAQQMVEYVRYGVLGYQRHMDIYRRQQTAGVWKMLPPRLPAAVRVSVLGLGEIGGQVARALAADGYRVQGWSRSAQTLPGILCHHGPTGLDTVLNESDVLVCVLPSTPQTRGLLDATRLARLPPGAMVINAGRGDLLDLDALQGLLESGHLRAAQLDVFPEEPLPPAHPLWRHPAVTITPHVAAITLRQEAVEQISANLRRLAEGSEPLGKVARTQGY